MKNNNNNHYDELLINEANFQALSPVVFLERAAQVYPDRDAIIYGDIRRSWSQTYQRCRSLASALSSLGISEGSTVTALLPNIPEMLELHFAVPMLGAVLNAQNIRLDAETIAFMLDHSESDVFIVDSELSPLAKKALCLSSGSPKIVIVNDSQVSFESQLIGADYEQLLSEGDSDFEWSLPESENQAISLNYTSGTTGNPKGVVYTHRGAYLNAISNIIGQQLPLHAVYLWTLPMFHCNGWCYPWAVTCVAGTHVCLRYTKPELIVDAINQTGVTHFCGAPIVLNMILNSDSVKDIQSDREITVTTGGAAPPAAIIDGMERIGIKVVHAYGLTETYGPSVFCDYQESWSELDRAESAQLMARQGVRAPGVTGVRVVKPGTDDDIAADGVEIGEVAIRSNTVMKGYLKNLDATDKTMRNGWLLTGDLAVMHPDSYIEIKDRAKDIIISGGENISTIEVEGVLYKHPDILEVAVVGAPDDHWGEVPYAVVSLKEGSESTETDLIAFCRDRMAHFKAPKKVIFSALPKTSTGKIQKFALKEMIKFSD